MDLKKINAVIRDTSLLDSFTESELKTVIEKYPYFQQAYALLAKKEVSGAGQENVKSLYTASVISSDRERLYEFIHTDSLAAQGLSRVVETSESIDRKEHSETSESEDAPAEDAADSTSDSTADAQSEDSVSTAASENSSSASESVSSSSASESGSVSGTAAAAILGTAGSLGAAAGLSSTESESIDSESEEHNERMSSDAEGTSIEDSDEQLLEKYNLDNKPDIIYDEELELAGDVLTEKSEEEIAQDLEEIIDDEAIEYSGELSTEEIDPADLSTLNPELSETPEALETSESSESSEETAEAEASIGKGAEVSAAGIGAIAGIAAASSDPKHLKKFEEKILSRLGESSLEEKEDFTLINEITPEIEAKLNDLGIYRFQQLRKLYTEDIPTLSLVSGIDGEKIQSERWFEQAHKIWSAENMEYVLDRVGRADPRIKDDLTKIKGIGKVLADKLYAVQITTYDQISRFTQEDIDIVNDVIEFFPGRIERDDWVGQAKSFLASSDTEDTGTEDAIISISSGSAVAAGAASSAGSTLEKLKANLEKHRKLRSDLDTKPEENKAENKAADLTEEIAEDPAEQSSGHTEEEILSESEEIIESPIIDLSGRKDELELESPDSQDESLSEEDTVTQEAPVQPEDEMIVDLSEASTSEEKLAEEDYAEVESSEEELSEDTSEYASDSTDISDEIAEISESAADSASEDGSNSFTGWLQALEKEKEEKKTAELTEPVLVKVDEDNVKEIHEFLGTNPDEIIKEDIPSFQIAEIAKRSLEENEALVSETLARVYESQELWRKAIEVYDLLRLKYPQKSSFFASRIKKLTQNL